ncbi:MAG: ribosome maturation factor RimP [Pseudonocardiales bacterium]|nr:ribosome maturation factor RimP [Pseudonocardiales bacterium]
MTARTPQRHQLIELLGPVIAAAGYDLDDLSVTAAGRRSLIRVAVDGDHGIDLDAVATISRAISDVLDDTAGDAAFAGPYVLEVSSPGVDRPLTEPRHWRRAVGRLVTVTVEDKELTGRVIAADNAEVVLEVAGVQSRLAMSALGTGRVQVEFSRPGHHPDEDDPELDHTDEDDAELDDTDEDDAGEGNDEPDDAEPVNETKKLTEEA